MCSDDDENDNLSNELTLNWEIGASDDLLDVANSFSLDKQLNTAPSDGPLQGTHAHRCPAWREILFRKIDMKRHANESSDGDLPF